MATSGWGRRRNPLLTSTPRDTTIIVPAFNEATRLASSLPQIADAAVALDAELLVVDDGSLDDTAIIARQLLGRVEGDVVSHSRNRGKGAAIRTGVERASGTRIIFLDADNATDVAVLPTMIEMLERADVVIGSRATPGSATAGADRSRVVMGRAFNRLTRLATGLPYLDTQCGCKGFRAGAARQLFGAMTVDGFAFDVEVLLLARRMGFSVAEVPVVWRAIGDSHVRLTDPLRMAVDVLAARQRVLRGRRASAPEILTAPEGVVTSVL